mmetsp:Transcript_17494/g.49636  ORF Transcript_17494/g.49636 Transcript_17494/m.49636 type:complete len:240 (+) Transcript_17494:715-1434(+)
MPRRVGLSRADGRLRLQQGRLGCLRVLLTAEFRRHDRHDMDVIAEPLRQAADHPKGANAVDTRGPEEVKHQHPLRVLGSPSEHRWLSSQPLELLGLIDEGGGERRQATEATCHGSADHFVDVALSEVSTLSARVEWAGPCGRREEPAGQWPPPCCAVADEAERGRCGAEDGVASCGVAVDKLLELGLLGLLPIPSQTLILEVIRLPVVNRHICGYLEPLPQEPLTRVDLLFFPLHVLIE